MLLLCICVILHGSKTPIRGTMKLIELYTCVILQGSKTCHIESKFMVLLCTCVILQDSKTSKHRFAQVYTGFGEC